MSRVVYDGVPVFVPVVLTMEQAAATFGAVRIAFAVSHSRDLAQAMHELAVAIDKKRAEINEAEEGAER